MKSGSFFLHSNQFWITLPSNLQLGGSSLSRACSHWTIADIPIYLLTNGFHQPSPDFFSPNLSNVIKSSLLFFAAFSFIFFFLFFFAFLTLSLFLHLIQWKKTNTRAACAVKTRTLPSRKCLSPKKSLILTPRQLLPHLPLTRTNGKCLKGQ